MRVRRLAVLLLLAAPLGGCIFAVGSGGESEALRDKVRDLENRMERLEGGGGVFTIQGMKFFLRTAFGDSSDFYGGQQMIPLQGGCQGNKERLSL